jgi:hypothetical protein
MRAAKFSVAVLMAMPIGALAQDQPAQTEQAPQQHHSAQGQSKLEEGQTSSSCISNFTFSREFLTRYPDAGGACREVKMENGQKWARFDASVARVARNQVTANFVDRADRNVGTITFEAKPDARVEVDGRPQRVSSLRQGDKLSFWMPQDRVGFYAEPEALDTMKLAVVDTGETQR